MICTCGHHALVHKLTAGHVAGGEGAGCTQCDCLKSSRDVQEKPLDLAKLGATLREVTDDLANLAKVTTDLAERLSAALRAAARQVSQEWMPDVPPPASTVPPKVRLVTDVDGDTWRRLAGGAWETTDPHGAIRLSERTLWEKYGPLTWDGKEEAGAA
jgi:hypothetical protein